MSSISVLVLSGCKFGHLVDQSRHYCTSDVIDTRVLFFEQSKGRKFAFNIIFMSFEIGSSYVTRLRLQMTIRNGSTGVERLALGQGTVRNLSWGVGSNIPVVQLGYQRNHGSNTGTFSTLIQKAIRNGLSELRKAIDNYESWHIAVDSISEEGKIIIPFGSSDFIEKGSLFPIYSKANIQRKSLCYHLKDTESDFVATAKVIDVNDQQSTLQLIQSGRSTQRVQTGDLIKAFRKHSQQNNHNENAPQAITHKVPLTLGHVYNSRIRLRVNGYWSEQDITPVIRNSLLTQARHFGFYITASPDTPL